MTRQPWFKTVDKTIFTRIDTDPEYESVTMDQLFMISQNLELEKNKGVDVSEQTEDLIKVLQEHLHDKSQIRHSFRKEPTRT